MSFVSIGDVATIAQFAWTIFKKCKAASSEYQEVSREVGSLHIVLQEIRDDAADPRSLLCRKKDRHSDLKQILKGCETVLQELDKDVEKYRSLGAVKKKALDKLRYGQRASELGDVRSKIQFHLQVLTLFQGSLQGDALARIEQKIDDLAADVRAGKKEATILSVHGSDESEDFWKLLKSELMDEGIALEEVEKHKDSVKAYIRHLVAVGALEEQPPSDSGYAPSQISRPSSTAGFSDSYGQDWASEVAPDDSRSIASATAVAPTPECMPSLEGDTKREADIKPKPERSAEPAAPGAPDSSSKGGSDRELYESDSDNASEDNVEASTKSPLRRERIYTASIASNDTFTSEIGFCLTCHRHTCMCNTKASIVSGNGPGLSVNDLLLAEMKDTGFDWYSCEICSGSLRTCDCYLRKYASWSNRDELYFTNGVANDTSSILRSFALDDAEARGLAKLLEAPKESVRDCITSPIHVDQAAKPKDHDAGAGDELVSEVSIYSDTELSISDFGEALDHNADAWEALEIQIWKQENDICITCSGTPETCDCFLRQLAKWNHRSAQPIYPRYMFEEYKSTMSPEDFIMLIGYKRLMTNLPEDFVPSLTDEQEWDLRNESSAAVIEARPTFRLDYRTKRLNGGWTRGLMRKDSTGKHTFIDLLAGWNERSVFLSSPILEESTPEYKNRIKLPPGWQRVETVMGRVYYEHPATGIAMYQHPTKNALVDQTAGRPILDFSPNQLVCAGLEGRWILDDIKAACQLSPDVFQRGPHKRVYYNFVDLDEALFDIETKDYLVDNPWLPMCLQVHDPGSECDVCLNRIGKASLESLADWRLGLFENT